MNEIAMTVLCMFSAYSRESLERSGVTPQQHDEYFQAVKSELKATEDLRQKLHAAEAELESKARRLDSLRSALVAHIDWEADQPEVRAFILRRQAEAVHALHLPVGIRCEDNPHEIIDEEIARLSQKADEIEAKE